MNHAFELQEAAAAAAKIEEVRFASRTACERAVWAFEQDEENKM
jgi:cob(I)alamin adenosyltransferase